MMFNRKGLDTTLNTTLVKRYTTSSGASCSPLRTRKESEYFTIFFFDIDHEKCLLYVSQDGNRLSSKPWKNIKDFLVIGGPPCRHSFSDGPVKLADAL